MPNIETTEASVNNDRKMSRAQRMRARMEDSSDESLGGLEKIFEAKLAAINVYEKQLTTVTDQYSRKSLQRMIRQERQELSRLVELIDLVENSSDMNRITRARRRFNHQLKTATGQDMKFWLGAVAVGALLLPSVREKLRPLAVRTVQGFMELTDQVQGLFSGVKEDIEDLVSEAQFEKFRQSIDEAIVDDNLSSNDINNDIN